MISGILNEVNNVQISNGLMVMLPGWVKHEVKDPKSCEHERVMIGNINDQEIRILMKEVTFTKRIKIVESIYDDHETLNPKLEKIIREQGDRQNYRTGLKDI